MRVLVAVNGDAGLGPPPLGFDRIVAADGGALLCSRAGLHPDLVVGDMDSLPACQQLALTAAGSRFLVHPDRVNKEQTDLELAMAAALAWKPDEIVLWGMWGNRPDHTLANILSLTAPSLAGVSVRAYASGWWFAVASPGHSVTLDRPPGTIVSLIPLGGTVSGIVTQGLRYPLPAPWEARGGELPVGTGRGVSNVLASQPATVAVETGTLLVVCGPPDEPGNAGVAPAPPSSLDTCLGQPGTAGVPPSPPTGLDTSLCAPGTADVPSAPPGGLDRTHLRRVGRLGVRRQTQ
jgi:thiamine pyrophosphokinase